MIAERRGERGGLYVKLRCDCGTVLSKEYAIYQLKVGGTRSCGCLNTQRRVERFVIHGMTNSPTYSSWRGMRDRCSRHLNYAGLGILVCKRWQSFANFLSDMGERPSGMSIERINNNGGYFPENCKWATRAEQNSNTRQNRFFTYNGQTHTISQWGKLYEIPVRRLNDRLIKLGWSIERALTPGTYQKRINRKPS